MIGLRHQDGASAMRACETASPVLMLALVQGRAHGCAGGHPICFIAAQMDAWDMQPCGTTDVLSTRSAVHARCISECVPDPGALAAC